MNSTRQINSFSAGMNMDVDYSAMKTNQYVYADNIRVLTNEGSSIGAIQNIEGFVLCSPSLNFGKEKIVYVTTIRDMAVVFTKNTADNNFNVYTFDFSKNATSPEVLKVVDSRPLDIYRYSDGATAISSVCRWESEDNIKIYWADGRSQIKVLNIDSAHVSDNSNIQADDITILPQATLPPFSFNGFGTGILKSGSIQYCYQLFKVRSLETAISQLTPLYHLSSEDQKSNYSDVRGDSGNQNTGRSVKLTVENSNTEFDRAKIISLFYKSKNAIPTITIVDDIDISGGSVITYEDKGGAFVSEISIDEFNALGSYTFEPEAIESKDNRLFAANITEYTWDVEYDARAYRSDTSGNILLLSNSGKTIQFNRNDLITTTISKDFDCICPFNSDDSSEYKYTVNTQGNNIFGGKGLNVSYRFITTDLIEDDSTLNTRGTLSEEFYYNASARPLNSLTLSYETSDKTGSIQLSSGNKIPNYSNAEIDAAATGYMRDEIYRFGIVMYNKRGMASPVHWIGDIRMPSNRDTNYRFYSYGTENAYGEKSLITTKPLGLEFEVNNLPDGVIRYEIVRCERTVSDRTILAQGIVSCVTNYDGGSDTLTPFPYLAYSTNHGYFSRAHDEGDFAYAFWLSTTQSPNYFMFISPEISVNKTNADSLVSRFQVVDRIGYVSSPITDAGDWGEGNSNSSIKVLANARSIKYNGVDIKATNSLGNQMYNGFLVKNLAGEYLIAINNDDFYSALLAKYYALYVEPTKKEATIESSKFAGTVDPWVSGGPQPWYNAPGVPVGNKTYYNWVWDNIKNVEDDEVDKTDANNVRKFGPHGACAVFKSDDMITNIPLVVSSEAHSYINSVLMCNIKQKVNGYGGNSYSAIQNSVYMTTGVTSAASESTNICFGGDTYINMFDYNNCMFSFYADDYDVNNLNRAFVGTFFPCESSINLAMISSDSSINRTYQAGTGYANHFVQDDITTIGGMYTQNTPSYAYMDAYSAQSNAKKFVAKSIYNIDNMLNDTRIMYSELKTNNELIDSWAKFKVANYIDLDTKFGPINDIQLFKNNLLFWQTDAFGTVSSNERSVITDNNPGALTLGIGGTLDRYDYFTTLNGLYANQMRAHTQSDSTVYWYDAKRAEICGFNGQLQTVSKLKGVQSYLNNGKDTFLSDPLVVYDKKYNEVLFTLENKTLAFNEQLGAFTSFYTYKPDYYAEFSDKLYMFNGVSLYKYNSGDSSNLYDNKSKIAYVKFVVNDGYPQTKTYDNVEYSGDFTYDTNFNDIYFETKRQTSYSLTEDDIDYREDTYKFCVPRNSIELNEIEQLANKSYKDRMKGKYLVCHYKYDCNDGNTFKVPYISTAYRYSMI